MSTTSVSRPSCQSLDFGARWGFVSGCQVLECAPQPPTVVGTGKRDEPLEGPKRNLFLEPPSLLLLAIIRIRVPPALLLPQGLWLRGASQEEGQRGSSQAELHPSFLLLESALSQACRAGVKSHTD